MNKKIYTSLFFFLFYYLLVAQEQVNNSPTYYKETFDMGIGKWKLKQANVVKWTSTSKGPATNAQNSIGAVDPPLKISNGTETWMMLDAYQLGNIKTPLIAAKLYSPRYDCSDFKDIYLQFNTLFRRNEFDEHLYIGISTDSINFEYKEIFAEVEITRFCDGKATYLKTQNPFVFNHKFDKKYVQQPKIWISFFYDYGSESAQNYAWQIDDIELFDHDPTPTCDLAIKDDYFALPPFAKIPISQLDSIPFGMDVFNNSFEDKKNTILGIEIFNTATKKSVFKHEKNILSINTKDTLVDFSFDKKFLPPAEIAKYRGIYYVKDVCADERPLNNSYSFVFEVTENTFQKENGKGTRRVKPSDFSSNNFNWSFGNHFYFKKGTALQAKSISFSIDNNYSNGDENIIDDSLSVVLYVWKNENQDDEAQPNELKIIAKTTKVIENTAKQFTFDLKSALPNTKEIILEDNTDYLAVVEYKNMNKSEHTMIMVANDTLFYDAAYTASKKNGHPLYNSVLKIGAEKNFVTTGFDSPMVPVVRLNLEKASVATSESIDYFEKNISVFPNPTNDFLFVKNADNQLFIEDIQVKNVLGQTVEIFYNDNKIDVSALNNAVYLLEIKTNKGTFAKKIIKN